MSAMCFRVACSFLLFLLPLSDAFPADVPKAILPEVRFEFGTAVRGKTIEHEFILKNGGKNVLRIEGVRLSSPLSLASLPAVINPGSQVVLRVRLDTSDLFGPFEGEILISLNDPRMPEARLGFTGRVATPIELSPRPVFFIAGLRGERRQGAIDIINHEDAPLRIESVEHPKGRFTTKLETVLKGRRYRLTLILNPDGPGGKKTETILLKTSSRTMPLLRIPANTLLRERVYTFPDEVDLGSMRLEDIRKHPDLLERTAQTLMVYQSGGSDFRVSLHTDLPMLDMKWERGPKGDRCQATIAMIGDKLQVGPVKGTIVIETNDPVFPKLTVPVYGSILGP